MKRMLDIGHVDVRMFLKSRSAYVWLFVVPFVFVYFMGMANRGANDPANRQPPLVIENQDTNFLGRVFLDELGAQGMRLLDPTNRDTAARGIRIPAGLTSNALQRTQTRLEFFKRESSAESDAAIVEVRLVRALIAMNSHIVEAATRAGGSNTITEAALREVMAAPNPVVLNARFAGRKPVPSGFNFSLPGNLVMYLMMNLLIFGGASVAAERRNGTIKRLAVHPVARGEIVMGKIYGLMLLGGVQILFFLAVGRFALGVNLGANLPGVVLTLLVLAWVAGSLGVLVGSLVASEDRVSGLCVLAGLLMAAVGGCWWPLELAPPALKVLALCVPTGWAMRALHQLISFGSGLGAVVLPLTVLIGFGAGANLLAARFFRT